MREMLRRLSSFVLLVAALLAVQPLLHEHRLQRDGEVRATGEITCAVCATGAGQLPAIAPSVHAPNAVLHFVTFAAPAHTHVEIPLADVSRAPPEL